MVDTDDWFQKMNMENISDVSCDIKTLNPGGTERGEEVVRVGTFPFKISVQAKMLKHVVFWNTLLLRGIFCQSIVIIFRKCLYLL